MEEIEAKEISCGEYHDKSDDESELKWFARVKYRCLCGRLHQVFPTGAGPMPEPMRFSVTGPCGAEVIAVPFARHKK